MITEKDVNLAFENEFDGVESFLLVQEILEERNRIDQLKAENEELKNKSILHQELRKISAERAAYLGKQLAKIRLLT